MERILIICLQTALFIFTCSVMSQVMVTKKPLSIPLYSKNKGLRQGETEDDSSPRLDDHVALPTRECVCSKIYDPVCASNNESYFNLCFLECKVPKTDNVTVVHQGNCIPF